MEASHFRRVSIGWDSKELKSFVELLVIYQSGYTSVKEYSDRRSCDESLTF
jgi:hypothetical protein